MRDLRLTLNGALAIAVASIATLTMAAPALAEALTPSRVRVIDGDTVAVCPPGGGDCERIRLADIDAPEIRSPRCVRELMAGRAARIRLEEMIAAGADIDRGATRDRYRRTLAIIRVSDPADPDRLVSVGAILVREGLARIWTPRPPAGGEPVPWCNIPVPQSRPAAQ